MSPATVAALSRVGELVLRERLGVRVEQDERLLSLLESLPPAEVDFVKGAALELAFQRAVVRGGGESAPRPVVMAP